MSADDFLVWSLDQPDLWELDGGSPILRSVATRLHDRVVVNLIIELGAQLRDNAIHPCTAALASLMSNGNVRRPDMAVDCGSTEQDGLHTERPSAFFEVLSDETETLDTGRKLDEYKQVPSLRHIVLIDPRRYRAWVWSRADEATPWSDVDIEGPDAMIDLPAIDVSLPLVDVYTGITFED